MTMLRFAGLFFALCIAASATASAQAPVSANSRLKPITDTKTIRIAYRTDATPFAFVNANNEPAGYSLDLCQSVVKSMAQQVGVDDIKIQWVPVTVQTRFSVITGGQADMECGSSTVTLGRLKEVDFSNYIFVESTGVVVTKASDVRAFSDMAGKKIAVISGTTNEKAVNDQIKSRNLSLEVVAVKDRDEAIAALESGKVDGYASDKLLLLGTQSKHPEDLVMLPDDLSIEPYAIALPQGDWALRLAINTGLAQIYRSGQIDQIFKRWFSPIGLEPGILLRAAYTLGSLSD
jgi:ABC-type amino acid transport substrate-binding protein